MSRRALFIPLLLAALLGSLRAEPGARLVVMGDYAFPPYSYLLEGRPVGIDVDILRELERRTGLQFEIRLAPFKRVVEQVREGSADLGMALLHNAEREGFAIFTGVLHNSTYSLFVRQGSPVVFDGLASLRGWRIGKVRGFFISEAFDAEVAAGRIQVEETAGAEQGLAMLVRERIDALSGQTVVTRHLARQAGLAETIRALPLPLVPDRPAFLVLSRASRQPELPALAERLRLGLQALHRDGTVARIEAKYLQ